MDNLQNKNNNDVIEKIKKELEISFEDFPDKLEKYLEISFPNLPICVVDTTVVSKVSQKMMGITKSDFIKSQGEVKHNVVGNTTRHTYSQSMQFTKKKHKVLRRMDLVYISDELTNWLKDVNSAEEDVKNIYIYILAWRPLYIGSVIETESKPRRLRRARIGGIPKNNGQ